MAEHISRPIDRLLTRLFYSYEIRRLRNELGKSLNNLGERDFNAESILQKEGSGYKEQKMLDEGEQIIKVYNPQNLIDYVKTCHQILIATLKKQSTFSGELAPWGKYTNLDLLQGKVNEPPTLNRVQIHDTEQSSYEAYLVMMVWPYIERDYMEGVTSYRRQPPFPKALTIYDQDLKTISVPKQNLRVVVKREN